MGRKGAIRLGQGVRMHAACSLDLGPAANLVPLLQRNLRLTAVHTDNSARLR